MTICPCELSLLMSPSAQGGAGYRTFLECCRSGSMRCRQGHIVIDKARPKKQGRCKQWEAGTCERGPDVGRCDSRFLHRSLGKVLAIHAVSPATKACR